MTNVSEPEVRVAAPPVSTVVQWMRAGYLLVAGLFVAGVVLQVFFAGAGVLVHPRYFALHSSFGHLLELLPLLLLLLSLLARLPWRLVGLNALIYVLFMLQYVFLYALGRVTGVPALRALHAVNALVLFWAGLYLSQRVWQLIRAGRRAVPALASA